MLLNLIGLVLPPVIDLVNKFVKDSRLRYVVSLLICILVGAVINFNQLRVGSVTEFLVSAGLVFAEAQTVYKLYWSDSAARAKLFP